MSAHRRALRTALTRLGFAIGAALPPRRRVVLATSHTEVLTGNLAWIHDELRRREPAVPVSLVTTRRGRGPFGRLAFVPATVVAGFHLATARVVVVDDYFFPMYVIRPRPGTRRIQVWHASGAFKKFGYSVLDKTFGVGEEMVRSVRIHSNYDLALVSSMSVAPHYAEAFRQPIERFTSRIGIPRTDLFFDADRRRRAADRVRARYPLSGDRRVILYAPTFRGDTVGRARDPGLLDLRRLHGALAEDHLVLLRLHPFIRTRVEIAPDLAGFAIDVSDDPDINELMLVSDLLVTDYSSAIYEFALLGRPILFLAPDEDAYQRERGLYLDFPGDLPGPVFASTAELAAFIRAGAFDVERVRAFAAASFDVADGRATARLVDEVILPALDGRWVVPGALPSGDRG